MKKHLVSTFILIVYITILIKVMVFKDMPTIRIGSLMLNFSGTDGGHPANLVPFKTILQYLLGDKGWIIAGANLVGNIAPLVPIGFLVPFVYRHMTWRKSLALAAAAGLAIEGMQVVLRVGIFDIDDMILNALGVMIGYWTFAILAKWMRSKNYKNIVFAAIIVSAALAVFYGAVVYPMSHQPVNPGVGGGGGRSDRSENKEGRILQSSDLCSGTGGTGRISSVGNNTITIKRNDDGSSQLVNLTKQTTIKTSNGSVSASDLKTGEKVTLVGEPNSDGTFTANTVLVCS
jgi:glycopeptide antibiotics resistance protein